MKENKYNRYPCSKKLIGHVQYRDLLINNFREKKLSHAWIFTGTKSIGKATLFYNIASEILSLATPANDENTKISDIRFHPDLYVIDKETEEENGNEIAIDDIRKLEEFVNLKSITTGHKIIIIDPADDLNLNAANALLKLLEEAPKNTYYFIVSHNIDKVLPTLKSRCNVVQLKDLSEDEALQVCKAIIVDLDEYKTRRLLEISGNSPGLVLKIWQNEGLKIYQELLAIIEQLPLLEIEKIERLAGEISGAKDKVKWELFTFFYGLILQKLIKILLKIEPGIEIIENEHKLLAKMIKSQKVNDFVFIAETADSIIRSAELSHLDKKQITQVLIEILKDSIVKE
jgi:DNA polymerase-3 subunit delta'